MAKASILIAMAISTISAQPIGSLATESQQPSTEFLKCQCNKDGVTPWLSQTVACKQGTCRMDKTNTSRCMIETIISTRPFVVMRSCGNFPDRIPFFADTSVTVGWVKSGHVLVFRFCSTDNCNVDFATMGSPWVDEEMNNTAETCLSAQTNLTEYMLQNRRERTDASLTCGCTGDEPNAVTRAPCDLAASRCNNFGVTEKNHMICSRVSTRTSCYMLTNPGESSSQLLISLHELWAAYVFDKSTGKGLFGCRDGDLCNEGLPEGQNMLGLQDVVCHWTCPKKRRLEPKPPVIKAWHCAVASIVLTAVCCIGVFVGIFCFRITLRLTT